MTDRAALDEELTRLHGQTAHAARLSVLHETAAAEFAAGPEEARFHLTHAWVYALVDGNDARIGVLERQLRAIGGLA